MSFFRPPPVPCASPKDSHTCKHTGHFEGSLPLTILLNDVLARSHELREALELVARHGPIATALEGLILLEVSVEVLLECEVAHEAHAADAAIEFHALEDFHLGCFAKSESKGVSQSGKRYLLLERVLVGEGWVVGGGVGVGLGVGSGLVKDKISERQLLRLIERGESL